MAPKRKKGPEVDRAAKNFYEGYELVESHPMFAPMLSRASVIRDDHEERNLCPHDGWAVAASDGYVYVHPKRLATPEEWAYVLTHCLLHFGFEHFRERPRQREWNAACDAYVARFLAGLKLGKAPEEMRLAADAAVTSEERLYERFCEHGVPPQLSRLGAAGAACDMVLRPERTVSYYQTKPRSWPELFGAGLQEAVSRAVDVAAGLERTVSTKRHKTAAERARAWFMSSYPLLGSLAASFEIVEDPAVCARLQVSVAAVDAEAKEIYVNPAAALDESECRFVIAHELLHVGLRHDARCRGRDPYLWNVAADYVINGWLVEMGVGDLPPVGGLYDPQLKGESTESVYDRIASDLRRMRKLATLRGAGLGDMLGGRDGAHRNASDAPTDLDAFYRRCLYQGLAYHEEQGRGYLPAGLVEEIRALAMPPIPWDVELAKWFDEHFGPIEKRRSYARQSRRQSSTPDIPRPRWVPNPKDLEGRTFGVVLDTSGSMDRTLLAKALGAIASYSLARDVPLARVVFCDAHAYDQGYMPPEEIAGRVKVRGRGGTILQPGIDLLQGAGDFPETGPILIITDGYCDRVAVKREHAYLTPEGATLPFPPRGPVFRMR